jgi:hypothetical protein
VTDFWIEIFASCPIYTLRCILLGGFCAYRRLVMLLMGLVHVDIVTSADTDEDTVSAIEVRRNPK